MKKTIIGLLLFIFLFDNSIAQSINKYNSDGITKEMIVLPCDFNLNKSLTIVGNVKTGDPSLLKVADFKKQLDKICLRAEKIGGNVIVINKVVNHKLTERYNLKATVYKIKEYNLFKDSLFYIDTTNVYSELILYRPNYTYSLNDIVDLTILVNGKEFLLSSNSKFVIRFENKATINIQIKGQEEAINLDTKMGQKYFIRCLVYFPNAMNAYKPNSIIIPFDGYVKNIGLISENGQGEIESCLINSNEKHIIKPK